MPKEQRAELHEQFARLARRGRPATASHEYEEILGYHLEQAYRYRTELGPSTSGRVSSAARRAGPCGRQRRGPQARGDHVAKPPGCSSDRSSCFGRIRTRERLTRRTGRGALRVRIDENSRAVAVMREFTCLGRRSRRVAGLRIRARGHPGPSSRRRWTRSLSHVASRDRSLWLSDRGRGTRATKRRSTPVCSGSASGLLVRPHSRAAEDPERLLRRLGEMRVIPGMGRVGLPNGRVLGGDPDR